MRRTYLTRLLIVGAVLLGWFLAAYISGTELEPAREFSRIIHPQTAVDLIVGVYLAILIVGLITYILFIILAAKSKRKPPTKRISILAMAIVLVFCFGALYLISNQTPELDETEQPQLFDEGRLGERGALGPQLDLGGGGEERPEYRPTTRALWLAALIFVFLAVIGLYFWRVWREEPEEPLEDNATESLADLTETLDVSIAQLRAEQDPRKAIIACYQAFQQLMKRQGFAMPNHFTAVEFREAVLKRFPIPTQDLSELTALFQLARFSTHTMSEEQKYKTIQCLLRIKSSVADSDGPQER